MSERPRQNPHVRTPGLDAAVRRAVGMRFTLPSLRSMLRACSMYANVIAVAVALGIPGGGLRLAAGSAVQAFESAVRSTRDSLASTPNFLAAPADLTAVTECEIDLPEPADPASVTLRPALFDEPAPEEAAPAPASAPAAPATPAMQRAEEPPPAPDNPEAVPALY